MSKMWKLCEMILPLQHLWFSLADKFLVPCLLSRDAILNFATSLSSMIELVDLMQVAKNRSWSHVQSKWV